MPYVRAAANCHVSLDDLAKRNRKNKTLDGTHPTAMGHQTIADEWIACLQTINGLNRDYCST